jgi:N-acylneuraminate cytidylyltransferase
VVVATDCQEIGSCVKGFNLEKVSIYQRNEENARDQSSTEAVMIEYLNNMPLASDDLFLLVQATSPFTTSTDFDNAIRQFKSSSADSMLSCSRVKRFLWNESGEPLNYQYQQRPRRQDFPGTMIENGAFYLNSVQNILSYKNRLSGTIDVYEMPSYASLELDEEDDWRYGEYLMKKYVITTNEYAKLRLFLSDVDGVLTDAGMYYTEEGDELKKFNTYDGMGFQLLQKQGVKVGIVTKEDRELNRRRAKKLGLDFDFHGVNEKLKLVQDLCNRLSIELEQVAYIGDDVNDQELLEVVGFPACPSNARREIKNMPGILQLQTAGGEGAVREFAELILASNNL